MTARKLLSALAGVALFVMPAAALAQAPDVQSIWNHHGYHWASDADGGDGGAA